MERNFEVNLSISKIIHNDKSDGFGGFMSIETVLGLILHFNNKCIQWIGRDYAFVVIF